MKNSVSNNLYDEMFKFTSCFADGSKILDLGCGVGKEAYLFKTQGYDVTAIDGSSYWCQEINKRLKLNATCMDIRGIDYDSEFSGIWCNSVIQHISKPDAQVVFNKCYTALRQSGVFFVSFKDKYFPSPEDQRTYELYTNDEIIDMAKNAGLKLFKKWDKQDSLGRDVVWNCYLFIKG